MAGWQGLEGPDLGVWVSGVRGGKMGKKGDGKPTDPGRIPAPLYFNKHSKIQ